MDKRLLIVDAESSITASLKVLFEARGFFVQTTSNGYDAVETYKKYPSKVVFSDIKITGMDGIELMHALRDLNPYVQFIFITGYASIENASEVLKQYNVFDYLEKPITDLEKLLNTIERAEEKYDRIKERDTRKKKYEEGFTIFRNIFDSIESIIYVADIHTYELIYINKKFKKTFGIDGEISIKGLKCWQIVQKGQTGPCPFCTNNRLTGADGRPGPPFQWELQNTRNHRWYSIVDKAIEWYDKRIVRLQTSLDITEKKEHETLFRQFEKAIETSKKLESIGTLAGGVAHDFNNTLSTIIGNINLAQLTTSGNETQKYLANAEKGVMQAKNISLNLNAFAKGDGLLKKKIDIIRLIQDILENSPDPDRIMYSLESDVISDTFLADRAQLKTAIGNILKNASESIGDKGRVDVAIKYLKQPLRNARISISISDSGRGISREHLDMIFNPYFTTKSMGSRKSKGLGLSIAWSIITKHGGDIHVESTLDKGTTFHIFLPIFNEGVLKDETGDEFTKTASRNHKKTTTRILVMDSNELSLDVISQLLQRLGYDSVVTSNGNQAVKLCQKAIQAGKKIDIALLDYNIKGNSGDGFHTMKLLKNIDPGIKGFLITGDIDNSEVEHYRCHGFFDLLEKPFSIRLLDNKIRKIMAQSSTKPLPC